MLAKKQPVGKYLIFAYQFLTGIIRSRFCGCDLSLKVRHPVVGIKIRCKDNGFLQKRKSF